MVDQRERIISQIHELELALARTDDKIANYGGAPRDGHSPGRARSAAYEDTADRDRRGERAQPRTPSCTTRSEGDSS